MASTSLAKSFSDLAFCEKRKVLKQSLCNLTYIYRVLSLLEAAKMEHAESNGNWLLSKTSFALNYNWQWVNVIYLLVQIIGELRIKNGQLVATVPSGPEESASLQWLLKEMQSIRHGSRNEGSQQQTQVLSESYQDSQLKNWVLAGTCYAFLLVSLPTLHTSDTQSELHQLQIWWEEKTVIWMESLDLPGSMFALEFLDKIAWLTSIEGETVIQQLYEKNIVGITV